jgi:hypothetical protein
MTSSSFLHMPNNIVPPIPEGRHDYFPLRDWRKVYNPDDYLLHTSKREGFAGIVGKITDRYCKECEHRMDVPHRIGCSVDAKERAMVTPVASHLPERGPMPSWVQGHVTKHSGLHDSVLATPTQGSPGEAIRWLAQDRERLLKLLDTQSSPHSERDEVPKAVQKQIGLARQMAETDFIDDEFCDSKATMKALLWFADRLSVPEHLRSFTCPRCLTPETITPAEASPTGYSCVQCGSELPTPEHRTTTEIDNG